MIRVKKVFLGFLCLMPVLSMSAQTLSFTNVDEILKSLTIEEKSQLLVGSIDANGYFGLPQPTSNDGDGIILIPGAAGQTNSVSRLGIPPTVMADGPAGLRIDPERKSATQFYYCTAFPVGIMLSSTWNPNLIYGIGCMMGNEVKEYGVDMLLAPGVNIMRNPLCGRNFEYYSEDPLLAGKICAGIVNGIQSQGVGTSVKHFAVNNQETNRYQSDSRIGERALREIYLKPFEIVVKEAKPWSVMSAYNKINGEFCQVNRRLLTDILRNEWGFDGFVVTDWCAPKNTQQQIAAGNDLMMPGVKVQVEDIVNAVKNGELDEKDLDISVRRVLNYIVKTPRFADYKYSDSPDLTGHAVRLRKDAAEGIVLLKNDGNVLPLVDSVKTVALYGVTSYNFIAGGTGSGYAHSPYVLNLKECMDSVGYDIQSDLSALYNRYIDFERQKFSFSKGGNHPMFKAIGVQFRAPEMSVPTYLAENIATKSDVAIITIGRESGEGFDRTINGDFNLSEIEQELIENVCKEYHKADKKVIVVLNVGGVIETASWKEFPDAILLAWQGGQEGAGTVSDILSGKSYPSGKLPITFPTRYSDVPSANDFPSDVKRPDDGMFGYSAVLHPKKRTSVERNIDFTEYTEGIEVGYRYYTTHDVKVSYPFGYGLGYSSFNFSNVKLKKGSMSVTVTNTGSYPGKEVVQLYVSLPQSSVSRPSKELKAFAKTKELAPGESETIALEINPDDLAYWNEEKGGWVVEDGEYIFAIGHNANNITAQATQIVKNNKFK